MRFLKNKLLRAQKAREKRQSNFNPLTDLCRPEKNNIKPQNVKIEESIFPNYRSYVSQSIQTPLDGVNIEEYSQSETNSTETSESHFNIVPEPEITISLKKICPSATKNIMINFGKAIISFVTSIIAIQYLRPRLLIENLSFSQFNIFVTQGKMKISGMRALRSLLKIEDDDSPELKACKRVFQYMSETFIKYYSYEWVMKSRLVHKEVYLACRLKMLRRIQNPEQFTYILMKNESW